ncbi:MAG: hypothetical protein M5U21_06615 [Fimbriimonadaceae bacterium]|nr:hypothetical protein [Fimbriimonadaceae bacterium]
MTWRLSSVFLLLFSFAACSLAVPTLFVVQLVSPESAEAPVDVPAASALAAHIDDDGRVFPIIWSLTDPIFRAAVDNGTLKNLPEHPDRDSALRAAQTLKAQYTLIFTARTREGHVEFEAWLFEGRRQVWTDKRELVSSGTGNDLSNALDTVGRTYAMLLGAGPFKNLPQQRKIATPDPGSGQRPNVSLDPGSLEDDAGKELVAEAAKQIKAGKFALGINLLRDCVDLAPFDITRRKALCVALLGAQLNLEAAREARLASEMFPQDIELRVISARGWLGAGNQTEALTDLNEAIARKPESPETRLLLGEVQLLRGRPDFALEHYDAALAAQPTAEGYFQRAIAHLLLRDSASAEKDLSRRAELEPVVEPDVQSARYLFVIRLAEPGASNLGERMRSLIQAARLDPGSQAVLAELRALAELSGRWNLLIDHASPPAQHLRSHELRRLALKLLAKALSEIQLHLNAPSGDALVEATIDLGECLSSFEEARAAFARENAS